MHGLLNPQEQPLRALIALPEFNSQQPHGGSQPFVMGSDALFCYI
ncbi:rCG50750 [Rattus norvegicus]|uniref:RCG50750 n=1 Tax=Rattus norvegicus TaxID=10116 RepID=A6KCF7_RAT|nr:rCG50750 [Rattus norvegicus]